MAKILAIDSSSKLCAVGLLNGVAVTSYQSPTQKAAAQSLLPLIKRLLSEATLSIRELDAIAVSAGPGSFTGIRIGMGIAQGLSEANSTPVFPISSLAHQAWDAFLQHECAYVRVAIHARESEFYYGLFEVSSDCGIKLLGQEQVGTLQTLCAAVLQGPTELKGKEWCAVGDAWDRVAGLHETLGAPALAGCANYPTVDSLCELAALQFKAGEHRGSALPLPNYVKEHMDYR
jgi:tRNA threonylcarbamoyladenosine biosynthesis protein TsaB